MMKIVARIKNDYSAKFGVPRQSGVVNSVISTIVFEPEFRDEEMLKGIEAFSHLWLIWQFSETLNDKVTSTVRPPKLGGNKRVGVFATRSPFRPNHIGLSSVRLLEKRKDEKYGIVLVVSGADLMNDTPIYDIKPYIPYTDCHTDANGGFTDNIEYKTLDVVVSCEHNMPQDKLEILKEVLSIDPRPSYQNDEKRVYSFEFSNYNISFNVVDKCLYVTKIEKLN